MTRLRLLSLRARRGQAAVLIALTLFSLIIFLAMATNMGIMVNDRIRMQNAADLAAYGAAYREAQQLNRLVQINKEILQIASQCRQTLTSTVWTGEICTCRNVSPQAEMVIEACKLELDAKAMEFVQAASYGQSVQPAMDVAKSTLDANVSGLGSGSNHDLFTSYSPTMVYAYQTEGIPTIADFVRVNDTILNYPVLKMCQVGPSCVPVGPVPSPNYEVSTWYYKDDTNPDVWVMVEAHGTMQSRYLDIDGAGSSQGYFGGTSDGGGPDTMYAVGVAKPYDGSVGPTVAPASFYRNGNLPDGLYYTPNGLQYPEMTMVEEYRARIAGIREWDSASASYSPKESLGFSRHAADVDKFRH